MAGTGETRDGRERDERYQQLVELAPDGILIHDGERIVMANGAAVRLAGATHRDQLIGLPVETFLTPPYLKGVEAQLTGAGDPDEPAPPAPDILRRLDGTELTVEVRAVAFADGGRPSVHLVIRDITERLAVERAARRVEDLLQQAQRMETVGALAGGVAHEVNNMLSVIIGSGEFVLRDPEVPAGPLDDVRTILNAAERAAAVVAQLLAFSRRAVHRPQAVDLDAAVAGMEPVIRRILGDTRHLVLVAEASPLVWVDRGQLEQVLVNLALNARDAMPDGGTVTIATGATDVPHGTAAVGGVAIPAGRYGTIDTRDTGSGMDAATQARVFEPFFTTKAVGQGTGLGLAAAYGVVTQNNGYITMASAPGQGAAFALYFPALAEPELGARRDDFAATSVHAPSAGLSVLVVDDEPAVGAIAARILERAGFQVLQARDGADALDLLERNGPPELVLTDLMMPGIGGAELARRIKDRWGVVPIIFMSGYSAEELCRQGTITSGRAVIQKPFTPEGLVRRVVAELPRQST